MRNLIVGVSLLALATGATAQVTTVPDVGAAAAAATAAPVDAAAAQRASEAEAAAAKEREAAQDRANEQARQAEKERDAAEERAKAQERAAAEQNAAAEKAAADRAAAEKAAADKATAEKAAAATAAAAPTGDARDVATQVCLAEAKSRATAVGATNVTMNEVKDTDKKSDGRASVNAKVNVVTTDAKGKVKVQKKSIKCETRNGVVTRFKWD